MPLLPASPNLGRPGNREGIKNVTDPWRFGDPPSEHDRRCRHSRMPRQFLTCQTSFLCDRRLLPGRTANKAARPGRRGHIERSSGSAIRTAGGLDDNLRPADSGRRSDRSRSCPCRAGNRGFRGAAGTIQRDLEVDEELTIFALGQRRTGKIKEISGPIPHPHARARFRADGAGDLFGSDPMHQSSPARTVLQRRHRTG